MVGLRAGAPALTELKLSRLASPPSVGGAKSAARLLSVGLSRILASGMSNSETPTMTPPHSRSTLSAHSGADFEAGRTGLPRGEQLEGRAVNDRSKHLPGGSA